MLMKTATIIVFFRSNLSNMRQGGYSNQTYRTCQIDKPHRHN